MKYITDKRYKEICLKFQLFSGKHPEMTQLEEWELMTLMRMVRDEVNENPIHRC